MKTLRIIPTLVTKYMLCFFHSLFCIFTKVDEFKVTFASYRSNKLTDNLLYIYEQVEKKYPMYKKKLLFYTLDSNLFGKMKYTFHMVTACYHLATSKYFIIDDYYIPLYMIKKRKNVEVIQLWHCSGALKKFGRSLVGKPIGPSVDYLKHVNVHGNYSKAYVSCTNVIPFFAEAFNMPEDDIYPYGNPRTDYLFDTNKHSIFLVKFYEKHPELKNKKIILYAPTFRGKSHYQDRFESPLDIKAMKENFSDEYILFIQL